MRIAYWFVCFFVCFSLANGSAQPANQSVKLPELSTPEVRWVDSMYEALSLDQRIGQLFMVAAYSGGEKMNQPLIEKLIAEQGIGGVIFMQGTPTAQAMLTNAYQNKSGVPMLIAMDAEWGLGMRLTGVRDFPRQMMLGAMHDSSLVYRMAAAIAAQCRRLGVHINFAPVVDINSNPNNPVINFRSFGENKYKVASMSLQYMMGLQDNGVMACAKHFPGHGDTEVDSHADLPEISKSAEALDKLELYPFKQLILGGIQSVMIAHLQVPAYENRKHRPSTLSSNIVTGLLRNKLNFNGLIFTDALNMEGVAKYYSPGEIDELAFEAGNDVLLFSQDVPSGKEKIKQSLVQGKISEERLAYSVKKILRAKYQAGLSKVKLIDTTQIDRDLNEYISPLRTQIAEQAITWLNDPHQVMERIKRKRNKEVTYVGVGTSSESVFSKELQGYLVNDIRYVPTSGKKEIQQFAKSLASKDAVIVGVHNMNPYAAKNFGLDSMEIWAIKTLAQNKNVMVVFFGNPYSLRYFCNLEGVMIAYDEATETQQVAAKMVMGFTKPKGKLPVTGCDHFRSGEGLTSLTNELGEHSDSESYTKQTKSPPPVDTSGWGVATNLECCVSPEAVGMDIKELDKLDNYLQNCVYNQVFPGCRVLAAKEGKVFYDKSFGTLSYNSKHGVDVNTLYDLASLTKVAATTLAIMKLYDDGKIELNAQLGKYLPITRGTDKEYLKIKDMLTHQAGLKSWIPFYKETLDSLKQPREDIYSRNPRGKFTVRVAKNLYMRSDWIDTMWNRILFSDLENRGRYVYSDLNFIFLQKVVEHISKKKLNDFVMDEFYKPLGLKLINYNPAVTLPGKEIAPTEVDDYFRYQTLTGYVHDMGAAMFGGVSGHAGLFATPNDVAVLFQMLLNGGTYGNKRYLQRSTVDLFTSKYSLLSRRGLGFDKPEPMAGRSNPCADQASWKTFGHTGFTGTCVWADPEQKLLYVFLSNATYPHADKKKINHGGGVREIAQSYFYKAMGVVGKYRK
jgi:beta-N-acetylhexosaminidase